jgi:streptogramin lyase
MGHLSNLFRVLKSSRRAQLVTSVLLGSLLLSLLVITPRLVRGATTNVVSINQFPIPTTSSAPIGIASGPDGNLWFTEAGANNIGRITPGGAFTEFPIPMPASQPQDIASGPDGNLWFTQPGVDNIGSITPAGVITEFPTTAGSEPFSIASGPDGNLWFTELTNNSIGRITPAGVVTEFSIATTPGSVPIGIASGPDGNLWFTESTGNKIGRISPAGVITEFPVPTGASQPFSIASGPDGNLWFTEFAGNKIGRITPDGSSIAEFRIPTGASQPFSIASGPDGNLWFTESNASANNIGSITPAGAITEFPVPTVGSQPEGIASGSDGNLWFTENSSAGNAIGQVTFVVPPTPTPTATPLPHLFGYPVDISTVAWKIGYDSHAPQSDIQPCYGLPYNQIWDAGQDYGFPATQTATGNWDNNTPVYAVADGTVLYSSQNGSGGTTSYPGGVVIIEHALPDGTFIYSMYADLDPAKILVAASTSSTVVKVTKGQQIAGGLIPQASVDRKTGVLVDNTHLHWEMRYFYDGSDIKQAPAYKRSCAGVPGPGYTYNSNDALAHPDNFQAVVGKSKGSLIFNTYHWTNPESFVQTH